MKQKHFPFGMKISLWISVAAFFASASSPASPLFAAPANDSFFNAETIPVLPYTSTGINTVDATGGEVGKDKDLLDCHGDPTYDRNAGDHSVWFNYFPTGNESVTVDTIGSNFDTMIGIYRLELDGTTLTQIGCDDDSGGNLKSLDTVNLEAGKAYYFVASSFNGNIATGLTSASTTKPDVGSLGGSFDPGGDLVFHVRGVINVDIAGINRGMYAPISGQSVRVRYAGLDSGPVKIASTDGTLIIAALRDAWAANGVTTSFAQLMGLPLEQLSDQYVFPGYNNVTLNEQLRISNVDTSLSTVTVMIGGVLRGTYPLAAGAAVRINYPGLDSGPVVVQGTPGVNIIAAIREAWSVNGVIQSFTQLMGLPAGQLSNKYVFPAYNNVTLNEQLRIGNVDPTLSTVVTVKIGGVLRGTYPLGPGQAVRINYAGLDSGPVVVEGLPSTVPIISSIRSAWLVNGVITSFAQLMGMPAGQLSNKYLFPAYNNVTLNGQLRFANVDTNPTTVTVTIGGVLRGTYPLAAGAAVRVNYAGLDSGPVVVEGTPSTVKIISAVREAWLVNGVITSFTQLMGLPAGLLSTTYLFPAYNNVTLNGQLRFGVP